MEISSFHPQPTKQAFLRCTSLNPDIIVLQASSAQRFRHGRLRSIWSIKEFFSSILSLVPRNAQKRQPSVFAIDDGHALMINHAISIDLQNLAMKGVNHA